MRSLPFEPLLAAGAALLTLLCGMSAGRMLAATLRTPLEWPLMLLGGCALLSHAVLALGLAGLATPGALAMLAASVLTAGLLVTPPPPPATPRLPRWLCWMLAPFALLYLVHALAPEISPDGLAYHAALPLRYLREGRVGFVPYNLYAQLSQGVEMLFLPAIAWGGRSAAALVHLGFVFALVALLWSYGRGVATRAGARAACVLVFCSPVVGIDGASAYTDVAAAAVLFGLYVCLARWSAAPTVGLAIVAGLLAGFGYAIKYTAGLGVSVGVAWLLWPRRPAGSTGAGRPIAWRHALAFALAAGLLILPWLVKNWAFTANPLAPFANAWFPNPVFDRWLEDAYVQSLRWYAGLGPPSSLPWELAGRGFVLNGLLGPAWLLAPLALLAIRQNEAKRLLAVGFVLALPFAANTGTRFLIPAMPFVALALAMGLRQLGGGGRWLLVAVAGVHLVLSWPWVASFYAHPHAWRIQEFPWRAALRLESEADFLGRKLAEQAMARQLNQWVPPGGKVLTQTQFTDALTHADMVTGPLSRPAAEWRRMIYLTASPSMLANRRVRFWFPTRVYEQVRLRQTAGSAASVAECRLYRLLTPVPAANPQHPATDGSTLTRAIVDGTLTLGAGREVDRIDCLYHAARPEPQFVLEAPAANGTWQLVAAQAELADYLDARNGRGAEAARILFRNGITFLLLRDADYHANLGGLTAEANMRHWPVRRVASEYGMHLYQLDRDRLERILLDP